jgi:hypothetical protein
MAANTPSNPAPQVEGLSGIDGTNKDKIVQVGALQVGGQFVLTPDNTTASDIFDMDADYTDVNDSRYGTASLEIVHRIGPYFFLQIDFTDLIIEVVDAGAGGSYGSVYLGNFSGDDFCIQNARLYIETLEENDAAVFTGDTTDTSPIITNVSALTDIQLGATVTGTGIAAGARVETIDSATQITLTENCTATGAGVTITQAALSGGDTAFEISLGDDEITVEADGDVGALGDDNAKYALIAIADVSTFDEPSDENAVANFTDDGNLYINYSGTAATVDASGSVKITGNIKMLGVVLGLD